ncbi:hypothetical protein BDF22DRAFT_673334 [Syncephalis plumigaleata]|nr:hypothetical protein BDF22DRAFT_673334 [Syncephalis plumigaleata]
MKHIIRITLVAAIAGLAVMSQVASAERAVSQPKSSECVFCIQAGPKCPDNCPMGQECVITESTCTECGTATCKDVKVSIPEKKPEPEKCLACAQVVPECPVCAKGQECVITEDTCNKCATATCKAVEVYIPEKPEDEECVVCAQVAEECPICEADQYCRIERQTCRSCGKSQCISKRTLPASASPSKLPIPMARSGEVCVQCLRQATCPKNCAKGEQCHLTVQDCNLCSTSTCVAVA